MDGLKSVDHEDVSKAQTGQLGLCIVKEGKLKWSMWYLAQPALVKQCKASHSEFDGCLKISPCLPVIQSIASSQRGLFDVAAIRVSKDVCVLRSRPS